MSWVLCSALQPGPLERRLLWTTLDAGRRKSLDDRRRGGGGTPPGMADLGGGAAAGLATATTGPEEAIGTPDWVAEFRCIPRMAVLKCRVVASPVALVQC